MAIEVTGLDLDTLAARVSGWLEEHLPAPWRQAARDGDRRALDRILADPATTSAWFAELGDSGLATPGCAGLLRRPRPGRRRDRGSQ